MSEYDVILTIAEALVRSYELCRPEISQKSDELVIDSINYSEAKRLFKNSIVNPDPSSAIIYGPPGTGKTKLVSEALYELVYEGKGPFEEKSRYELLFYVAPTNDLVISAVRRVFTYIFCALFKRNEVELIPKLIYGTKVLGSKITNAKLNISSIDRFRKLILQLGVFSKLPPELENVIKELEKMVQGKEVMLASQWMDVDLEGTHLVFTTAYQTLKVKDISRISDIHVIYDEASKIEQIQSHRVLLSILQNYIRNVIASKNMDSLSQYLKKYVESINTLIAMGDKFQAITVQGIAGKYSKLLIEELEKHGAKGVVLDVTLRLPHPTELSLSKAFYEKYQNTRVRAHEVLTHEKKRLLKVIYEIVGERLIDKIGKELKKISLNEYRVMIDKIIDALIGAMNEGKPGIIIDFSQPWRWGQFNRLYVAGSVAFSAIETLILSYARMRYDLNELCYKEFKYIRNVCLDIAQGQPITILSMYRNVFRVGDHARVIARRLSTMLGIKINDLISSKTISSNIGNESPIIVHELPKDPWIGITDERLRHTFIVRDPLQIVVGVSRHSLIRTIVGDIEGFIKHIQELKRDPRAERIIKELYGEKNIEYLSSIGELIEQEKQLAEKGKAVLVSNVI